MGRQPTVILACGGYRSGSTLHYNLLAEYVERSGLGVRLGFVQPQNADAAVAGTRARDEGVGVVKCHHVTAGYHDFRGRDEAWGELVLEGLVLPVYSVRDWRDVAQSMSRKFGIPVIDLFESALWRENIANLDRWLELGAVVQRYELLVEEPKSAIQEVMRVAALPFEPSVGAAAAVAADLDRASRAMSTAPTGSWDERTLIHDDHLADPGGGAWRRWTPEEVRVARPHIEPLMQRFGNSWEE